MPRLKFPINKFRNGTVTSFSNRDAPPESPEESSNIDPTSESGTLTPLQEDDVLATSGEDRGWVYRGNVDISAGESVEAKMDKMGIIDDDGTHRLVYYNDTTNTISTIDNLWGTTYADTTPSDLFTAEAGSGVTMVNNNKELHIGLGKDRDSNWTGIIENKQFGTDYSDDLVSETASLLQPSKIINVHKVVKANIDGADYFYTIHWKGNRIYVFDGTTGVFVKKLKHRFSSTQALSVYETGNADTRMLIVYDSGMGDGVIYQYDPREDEDKIHLTHTLPEKDGNGKYSKNYKDDITDIISNWHVIPSYRKLWIFRPLVNEQIGRKNTDYGELNDDWALYAKAHLWKADYDTPQSADIEFKIVSSSTGHFGGSHYGVGTQKVGDWDIYKYPSYSAPHITMEGNTWAITNKYNTGSFFFPQFDVGVGSYGYDGSDNTGGDYDWDGKFSDKTTKLRSYIDYDGDGSITDTSLLDVGKAVTPILPIHLNQMGVDAATGADKQANGHNGWVNFQQCLCKVDTKYGVYFIAGHKYYDLRNIGIYTGEQGDAGDGGTGGTDPSGDIIAGTGWNDISILTGQSYGLIHSNMPDDGGDYDKDYDVDQLSDSGATNKAALRRTGFFTGELYSAGIFSEDSDGNDRHTGTSTDDSYPSGATDGNTGNTGCVGPYFVHGQNGYVASDKDTQDGSNTGVDHTVHGKIKKTTVSEIFSPMSASAVEDNHIHTTTSSDWFDNAASDIDEDHTYTEGIVANNGFNIWAGMIRDHSPVGMGMAWGWIDIAYDNTVSLENVGKGEYYDGNVQPKTAAEDGKGGDFNSDDKRWRGPSATDYCGTVFFLGFNSMQTGDGNVENGEAGLATWSLRRKGYVHSDYYISDKWIYRGDIIQDKSNYDENTDKTTGAYWHREKVSERSCFPGMMKVDTTNQLIFVGGKRRGSFRTSDSGIRNWMLSFNYNLNEIDSHEIIEFDLSKGAAAATKDRFSADNFECFHLDEKDMVLICGGGHPQNESGNAGLILIKYNKYGEFTNNTFTNIPNLAYAFAVDPIRKLIFTNEPISTPLNKLEDTSSVYQYNPETLAVTRLHDLHSDDWDLNTHLITESSRTMVPSMHGSFWDLSRGYHQAPHATYDYDYHNRIIAIGLRTTFRMFTYNEDGSGFRMLQGHGDPQLGWDPNHEETIASSNVVSSPNLGQSKSNWIYNGEGLGGAGREGSFVKNARLGIRSINDNQNWKDFHTYTSFVSSASNAHAGVQLTYSNYYGWVKDNIPEDDYGKYYQAKNKAIICHFSSAWRVENINSYYKHAHNARMTNAIIAADTGTNSSHFGSSINCANGFSPPNYTLSSGYSATHGYGYGCKRQASPIHYAANRSPLFKNLSFGEDYVTTPKTPLFTYADKQWTGLVYQTKNDIKIWEDATVDGDGAHSGASMQVRKFLVGYRSDVGDRAQPFGSTATRNIYRLGLSTVRDNVDFDNPDKNFLYGVSNDETNSVLYLSCINKNVINDDGNITDPDDTTSILPFTLPVIGTTGEFEAVDLDINTLDNDDHYNIKKGSILAGNRTLNIMSGDGVLVHGTIATETDGDIDNTNNALIIKEIADAELILTEENDLSNMFKEGYKYFYKMSYLYDGYQEGPLSESSVSITSSGKKIKVTANIYDEASLSKRVSHLLVYRAYTTDSESVSPDGFYRLVNQLRFDTRWGTFNHPQYGDYFNNQFIDDGASGPSFESSAQLPEVLDVVTPKYALSTSIFNTHFIADITHPDIDKGSNMLCKSIPFQFDVFDITNDLIRLPKKPTALSSFNNRVYVFSNDAMYRVEPNNFSIEHTYEGVGCIGRDSIVSFDLGMAWATSNNIYMFDGNVPIPIGNAIRNSNQFAWDARDTTVEPILGYSSRHKSILVCFKMPISGLVPVDTWYAWMYNVIMQRWDMANFFTSNTDGTGAQSVTSHNINSIISGKDGDLLYNADVDSNDDGTPNVSSLYRFTSETSKVGSNSATNLGKFRDLIFKSNSLTFGFDGAHKKLLEIRILAKLSNVTSMVGRNYLYLRITKEGIDGGTILATDSNTYEEVSDTYRLYKFKLSKGQRKGLNFSFKVITKGHDKITIDSIVLVYRPIAGTSENQGTQ